MRGVTRTHVSLGAGRSPIPMLVWAKVWLKTIQSQPSSGRLWQTLSRHWADFGSPLGRLWADFGPTLDQPWADFGSTLAHTNMGMGDLPAPKLTWVQVTSLTMALLY